MFLWSTDVVVSSENVMYFQRPMGLLALLDEESKFPRATDLSLAGNHFTQDISCPLRPHCAPMWTITSVELSTHEWSLYDCSIHIHMLLHAKVFYNATFLFAAKFHSNFKSSPYYKKPKDGGPTFTIMHYAGNVSAFITVEPLNNGSIRTRTVYRHCPILWNLIVLFGLYDMLYRGWLLCTEGPLI